jgi:hypothetical protein
MSIVLDGSLGITTPDLASGPVAGTTANFSGNVTLGSSVLATPSGSAPSYTCRAWVNFDGTTSPGTIRASGNVSSVTRNGTGDYTVNFTTAMPDADYAAVQGGSRLGSRGNNSQEEFVNFTASSVGYLTSNNSGNATNYLINCISIFR